MEVPRCPSCTEIGTLRCLGCEDVHYCSHICREADWKIHKILCATRKDFQDRPSPDSRRVVVFPPDARTPEFVWWPISRWGDGEDLDYKVIPGLDFRFDWHENGFSGAKLSGTISVLYDHSIQRRSLSSNLSVASLPQIDQAAELRGLLVGCCRVGTGIRSGYGEEMLRVSDMGMQDFSDLLSCLYTRPPRPDWFPDSRGFKVHPLAGPKIEAVRMNCDEERVSSRAPSSELVHIPKHHPIFTEANVSPISREVGLRLVLWKEHAKVYSTVENAYHNQRATSMQADCEFHIKDSSEPKINLGLIPPRWREGKVPNVLIARLDRAPLHIDMVGAFGDFCQFRIGTYFLWQRKMDSQTGVRDSDREIHRNIVWNQITLTEWAKYLAQWHGIGLISASSPANYYDVESTTKRLKGLAFALDDRDKLIDELFAT